MKAILEFDLSTPEEKLAHKRAISATDMYIAVHDFDNYLRNRLKYEELPDAVFAAVEAARTRLHQDMADMGVSLEDLE